MVEIPGSAGAADDLEPGTAAGKVFVAAGGADEAGTIVDATIGESGDDAGVCSGAEARVVKAWTAVGVEAGTVAGTVAGVVVDVVAGVVLGPASFAGAESDYFNQQLLIITSH